MVVGGRVTEMVEARWVVGVGVGDWEGMVGAWEVVSVVDVVVGVVVG